MDRITIQGIRAHGKHGADPGERERAQPFDIDIVLYVDLQAAANSDRLADTVDYAKIHRHIVAVVEDRSFELLERLAAEMFVEIFHDARVASAEVSVGKPRLLDGATPTVKLFRNNPRHDSGST